MRTALPIDAFYANEAKISFMNESRRLQGMVRSFASQVHGGDATQLSINQRDKPPLSGSVASFEIQKDLRDLARRPTHTLVHRKE
jgi:hypothetical protein